MKNVHHKQMHAGNSESYELNEEERDEKMMTECKILQLVRALVVTRYRVLYCSRCPLFADERFSFGAHRDVPRKRKYKYSYSQFFFGCNERV